MTTGYSGKTLVQKLGIRPEFTICILNAPDGYKRVLGKLPDAVTIREVLHDQADLIQFFTTSRHELESAFAELKSVLKQKGALWICWPKMASSIASDLNDNIVRDIGLHGGLVDVKVIAVDQTWSGIKFVYRVRDRQKVGRT